MKLFVCVSFLACANLAAMHGPQKSKESDNLSVQKKLTILDLHQMTKEKFTILSDHEKWKLVEDSRELIQKYALVVAEQNNALIIKEAALQELRRATGAMTVGIFLVNNTANSNNHEKN